MNLRQAFTTLLAKYEPNARFKLAKLIQRRILPFEIVSVKIYIDYVVILSPCKDTLNNVFIIFYTLNAFDWNLLILHSRSNRTYESLAIVNNLLFLRFLLFCGSIPVIKKNKIQIGSALPLITEIDLILNSCKNRSILIILFCCNGPKIGIRIHNLLKIALPSLLFICERVAFHL